MSNRFQQPAFQNLIAFEAAARTGSFTRAAEELHISQPAISHAMRVLEEGLGVPLFERRHKGVAPTEAGRYLQEQVTLGLTLIDQALREVRTLNRGRQVTLAVSTATATWWLLPRIARFKQIHPEIELRCITTDIDLDLERERIDLAITLGAGEFVRNQRWHFVDEEVFPVCSPGYLHSNPGLKDPQSLSQAALLHLEERYRPRLDWAGWLARFGVALASHSKAFSFNDYSIVLQAALEGQGVALGWRHIVAPLIAQGRLVRPVTQSVITDQPLYIVASRAGRARADAMALREWLVQEAGSDRAAAQESNPPL
jgi:LysR family transcriptional regulator, glycine cleavage system transcriptional activator